MSPSPGDALVCCVKKGRYQPARDKNWYRQTTTTLAFMITVVGQALIFWLPSCGCNSPQLEAHSAVFTPVTHNWFEGVRLHVVCLSFHHVRLGGSCYSPTTRIRLIWISPTTKWQSSIWLIFLLHLLQ